MITRTISFSACVLVMVFVAAACLRAEGTSRTGHAQLYRVFPGPVEFRGFRTIKSEDDKVAVRDLETPLHRGAELRIGDEVDEGIIRSTKGGAFALKNNRGYMLRLEEGEAAVILTAGDEGARADISCAQCAELSLDVCQRGRVHGVTCKPDGSYSFQCKSTGDGR